MLGILFLFASACDSIESDQNRTALAFERFEIDDGTPAADPWGKIAADLNGDRLVDVVIANHGAQTLVAYYGPDWAREVLATGQAFATDVEIEDIDNDGHMDIIAITDTDLLWYRGPDWSPATIAKHGFHDIEMADLDADGRNDIVARGQSAFGGDGHQVWIFHHQGANRWRPSFISVPEGEGLALGDLNQDNRIDIVVNQFWLENTEDQNWTAHRYSDSWSWPNTTIAIGDLNKDGREDILLTPAELAGQTYRISWFENTAAAEGLWTEHVIDEQVESVLHSAAIGDADLDGDSDVLIAEMHQGEDPDNIVVYLNKNNGTQWQPHVVDTIGSHGATFVDIDRDGDLDILGANYSDDRQEIYVWDNLTCRNTGSNWIRHEIDGERPGTQAPFVEAVDLDSDGRTDVITGGYWYKNPGDIDSDWQRTSLGSDQPDLVKTTDLGHDGDIDILVLVDGSTGREFRWLNNSGEAKFTPIDTGITASGDFLQGVVELGEFGGDSGIALSWHQPGIAVELIRRTEDGNDVWILEEISSSSQDEALSSGDIDGDGDSDVLFGTVWSRNEGDGWTNFLIDSEATAPDRNALADIDGDGLLDAVVGFEAISAEGDLVWYRHNGDPTSQWDKVHIGSIVGPMSVGVADIDLDGDLDIVAGEHNLQQPDEAALWFFENVDGTGNNWVQHLLYRGDEHHDGALVVDIDHDGDSDIVSIGWGHSKVLVYENRNAQCRIRK